MFALFHPSLTPDHGLSAEWTWDPWALAGLLPCVGLYAAGVARLWRHAGTNEGIRVRELAAFAGSMLVLTLALLSPLDDLSDALFSAHMSQHELLMLIAAPLMVLARPFQAVVWVLPERPRKRVLLAAARGWPVALWRFLTTPLFALALHAAVRWLWHDPALFEAAMEHPALHAFQHLTFFGSASLFWWCLLNGRYGKLGYGVALLFVFATATHTGILGALISLSPHVVYRIYEARSASLGIDALRDQQLAGLLMWVPAGIVFSVVGLALFAAWLGESRRRSERAAHSS